MDPKKRRLTGANKLKLARLAYERFIDPKLRTKETKARQALIDAIVLAAERIPLPELGVLRRHNLLHKFDKVGLPYQITVPQEAKTFTRPDGRTIERAATRNLYRPTEWDYFQPQTLKDAINGSAPHKYYAGGDRRTVSDLTLPKAVEVPCLARTFSSDQTLTFEHHDGLVFHNSTFMTPKIVEAVKAYYVIAHERRDTELALAQAASRLISASTHYSQILDFWPEAKEIEKDLWEDKLPSAVSLITFSDEDKAALCSNLKARGVKGSSICKVAKAA